jgi:S-formylglutathione hydrolase FrmB
MGVGASAGAGNGAGFAQGYDAGAQPSASGTAQPADAAGPTSTSVVWPDASRDNAPAGPNGSDATLSPTKQHAASDAGSLGPLPPGYPGGSASRLERSSFVGPITGQTIRYNVYVPPGYDGDQSRYPTLYDLHGLDGNQDSDDQVVTASLESAMHKNLIGPLLVVFPDGLTESYYANSKDGTRPSETRIIRELIPHIDATFRTIADRSERIVTGFSMGGYGSMEFAVKFPDLFRAGITYDGALDTWATLTARRDSIAQALFGGDESYFNLYSPWSNVQKNAAVLAASTSLRIVSGTTYAMFDSNFNQYASKVGVTIDYIATSCPHDYGCDLMTQGIQSWTFLQNALMTRP